MTSDENPPIMTYTLTVHAPLQPARHAIPGLAVLLDRLMREAEENMTDLLPDGWWVEIHEWDEQSKGQLIGRDPEDDSGYYMPGQRRDDEEPRDESGYPGIQGLEAIRRRRQREGDDDA